MAANMSVLGLILSSYPYLRSAMVRFPFYQHLPASKDAKLTKNKRFISSFNPAGLVRRL